MGKDAADVAWRALKHALAAGLVAPVAMQRLLLTSDADLVKLLETVGGAAITAKRDDLARQLYEAALLAGSQNSAVAYNLGNITMRAGEIERSISAYTLAIELDNKNARAYFNRGIQLRRIGEEERARVDILSAIVNGYNDIDAYAALYRSEVAALDVGAAWSAHPTELYLFALAQAEAALRLIDSGADGLALLAAQWCVNVCRSAPQALSTNVAMVIILDVLMRVHVERHDRAATVSVGAELIELSRQLAGLASDSWPAEMVPWISFVVERLPLRIAGLMLLYAASRNHQAVLITASQAIEDVEEKRISSDASLTISEALRQAVYLAVRKKAESGQLRPPGWKDHDNYDQSKSVSESP